MKKIVFVLLALCSCAGESDLEQMKKYQISADMEQMRYAQQDRDEKLRKEMKQEHKGDVLFNLAVTREQVNIDNHKFDMINRYHIDGSEHLTWDNIDRYNQILNKDRARLENEDGIARPDDVPTESPPNNPEQYKNEDTDMMTNTNHMVNDSEETKQPAPVDNSTSSSQENQESIPNWTPQHYTDTPEKDTNRSVEKEIL